MAEAIYLDHHTRARPSKRGLEEFALKQSTAWGSLFSPHESGQGLTVQKDSAIAAIKEGLGAKGQDRFLLTSGGASSNFKVLFSTYADFIRDTGRTHLLTTPTESQWITQPIKQLEKFDVSGKNLPLNHQGQITTAFLEEHIRSRTALVSISWANGLTGVIQPIWDIAEICKEKKVLLHVDVTYAIGKLYFRFEDFPIDFLTFDANALHTPFGIGGILVREGSEAMQMSIEEEEMNLAHLSTLKVCLQDALNNVDHVSMEIARLRDEFETAIQNQLPDAHVLFHKAERLPTSSVISFPGVSSDALLFELSRHGLYASMGGGIFPSLFHILQLSGIEHQFARSALSFSFAFDTSEQQVEKAVQIIVESVKKIQKYSMRLSL